MAVYQFKATDGGIIERHFPMAYAPDLGHPIRLKGKVYRRILSTGIQLSASITEMCSLRQGKGGFPKRSSTLPTWCEGANHVQEGKEMGKPIIESRTHQDELCKQHGYTRDYHPDDTDSIPVVGAAKEGQAVDFQGHKVEVRTEIPKSWGEPSTKYA